MTSKKLGRFDVDSEISASALGPLHRARAEGSPFLARVVKLRPPLGKADAEALHEAAKGGVGLYHPCVASFTEGLTEGNELALFFAGDGEALATLQKRALLGRKPFPGPVLLRLVIDLADGVQALTEHAAAAGKTAPYGGITPENVIVGDDGVARVVDLLPSAAATADTWVRAPRRAAYQAPEAFRKEPLTAASDVFSLGVLAWELASNRTLFVSASLAEIEKRVLAPTKRADAVKPAGGEALDAKAADVLERALSLTAADRPASAAALAAALRDAGVALATHDEIAAYVRSLGEKPGSVKTPVPSETKPKASEPLRSAPKPAAPKAAETPVVPSTPVLSKSIDDALDDLDVVSLHSVRLPPPPPVRRPIPLGKPVAPAPAKKPAATDDIDVSFDDAGATSVEPPAPSSPAPSSPAPSSGETPRPSSPFGLSKSLVPPPDPEAPPSVPSLGAPGAPAEASTTAPAKPAADAEKAEPKAQIHGEKAGSEGPAAAKAKLEEAEPKEALSEKAESKEAEPKEALSEKAESKEALSEKAESKEALSEKAESEKAESKETESKEAESKEAESKEAAPEGAAVGPKAVEAKPAEPAPVPKTPEAAPKAAQSRRSFEAPKPAAAAPAEAAAPLLLAPPSLPTVAANDAEAPPGGKKGGLGLWIGGGLLALVAVLAFAFLGGSDDEAPPPSVTPTTATAVATTPTAAPAPPPPEAAVAAPIPTPEPLATAAPTASEAPAPVPTPAATPSPAARPAQATNGPSPAPAAAKPTGAKPASKPAAAPPKGNSKKYIPGGI